MTPRKRSSWSALIAYVAGARPLSRRPGHIVCKRCGRPWAGGPLILCSECEEPWQ